MGFCHLRYILIGNKIVNLNPKLLQCLFADACLRHLGIRYDTGLLLQGFPGKLQHIWGKHKVIRIIKIRRSVYGTLDYGRILLLQFPAAQLLCDNLKAAGLYLLRQYLFQFRFHAYSPSHSILQFHSAAPSGPTISLLAGRRCPKFNFIYILYQKTKTSNSLFPYKTGGLLSESPRYLKLMIRVSKGCDAPALYHILMCKLICNNNIWYERSTKSAFNTLIKLM